MECTFLNKPYLYWIEVQRRLESEDAVDYIEEIAFLRSKVSFYERRINDMALFMSRNLESNDISNITVTK